MKNIITLAFLLIGVNTFSQNWVYVGRGADNSSYFMRSTSVEESSTKKVWVKHNSTKIPIKKKGKPIVYANGSEMILYEFDCSSRQVQFHSITTYNSNGSVIKSSQLEDYEKRWMDVVPDSIGEMLLNKACELF